MSGCEVHISKPGRCVKVGEFARVLTHPEPHENDNHKGKQTIP